MTYIFTSKDKHGSYHPEKIVNDLDNLLSGLEYGDVKEGEFQVWQHPSGIIFDVRPDREVEESNYYSLPYNKDGIVWLPRLLAAGEDKEKVEAAYKVLSGE